MKHYHWNTCCRYIALCVKWISIESRGFALPSTENEELANFWWRKRWIKAANPSLSCIKYANLEILHAVKYTQRKAYHSNHLSPNLRIKQNCVGPSNIAFFTPWYYLQIISFVNSLRLAGALTWPNENRATNECPPVELAQQRPNFDWRFTMQQ